MRARKRRRVERLELELEMGKRRKGRKDRNRMGQVEETDKVVVVAVAGHLSLTRPLLLRVLELFLQDNNYDNIPSFALITVELERTTVIDY